MNSKIISSLQPKVGKIFENHTIESRKMKILNETRKKLIMLAIEEKEVELHQVREEFEKKKAEYTDINENPEVFLQKLETLMNALTSRLNGQMNKKVSFHLGRQETTKEFVRKKPQVKKKRKWTASRKKKNRIAYRTKLKRRKQDKLRALVSKIIAGNTVVNLSNEVIPDAVYVFLSKGLGFVPSQKVNVQELKYDSRIRKEA